MLNAGGAVPGDRYDDALFENPGTPGRHWLEVRLIGVRVEPRGDRREDPRSPSRRPEAPARAAGCAIARCRAAARSARTATPSTSASAAPPPSSRSRSTGRPARRARCSGTPQSTRCWRSARTPPHLWSDHGRRSGSGEPTGLPAPIGTDRTATDPLTGRVGPSPGRYQSQSDSCSARPAGGPGRAGRRPRSTPRSRPGRAPHPEGAGRGHHPRPGGAAPSGGRPGGRHHQLRGLSQDQAEQRRRAVEPRRGLRPARTASPTASPSTARRWPRPGQPDVSAPTWRWRSTRAATTPRR